MKILRYFFSGLYRIWFHILVGLITLALFPLLLVSILRQKWYPFFFGLARLWARAILFGMGFFPRVKRDFIYKKNHSYVFVANHTSMTDIMLMLYVTKNPFVFVGKKELAKIPFFGFLYKRTCILVDRNNIKSRRDVFESAEKRLRQGLSVCIFPEGGVPDDMGLLVDEFKDGAFRLAIEHKIPIAPMTFHDNKNRLSFQFFSGRPGRMRVIVHDIIPTGNLSLEDKRKLKSQTREVILKELQSPTVY